VGQDGGGALTPSVAFPVSTTAWTPSGESCSRGDTPLWLAARPTIHSCHRHCWPPPLRWGIGAPFLSLPPDTVPRPPNTSTSCVSPVLSRVASRRAPEGAAPLLCHLCELTAGWKAAGKSGCPGGHGGTRRAQGARWLGTHHHCPRPCASCATTGSPQRNDAARWRRCATGMGQEYTGPGGGTVPSKQSSE